MSKTRRVQFSGSVSLQSSRVLLDTPILAGHAATVCPLRIYAGMQVYYTVGVQVALFRALILVARGFLSRYSRGRDSTESGLTPVSICL